MTDHTDNGLNLGNFVFDDNNQERKSWKCFGQTCNRSLVVFCPNFCFFLLNISVLYSKNNSCQNLGRNNSLDCYLI